MKIMLGLAAVVLLFTGAPANAILIATATANGSPPPDDPGWAHVGTRTGTDDGGNPLNGLTLIYLGNGWVITAAHAKEADLLLGGQVYPRVVGSKQQLQNDDLSLADVIVYRVSGNPDLPALPILEIAATSPAIGTPLTLIGRGRNRGGSTNWQEPAGPLRMGWDWAPGASIRWGTNLVADPNIGPTVATDSFVTDFTKPGDAGFTSEEGQVVTGDSGGGAFYKVGGEWQLAGIAHMSLTFGGQPANTSIYGNLSYMADLARFRDQIIPLVRPQCSDEVDNDGDGHTDYPDDPDCPSREFDNEMPKHLPSLSPSGLTSLVIGMLGLAIVALRSRPRR